ncbi:MAG: membrane integrity-associated transporter subunit PqiC [Magnetococcales bacterium]|nr:membrane integrity-associated transporter subunit PqiC [Magnetococcales bacterium]
MKWHGMVVGLIGALLLLSGCARMMGEGTPATRFYIISPLTIPTSSPGVQVREPELSLALEPLLIPSYLNRPQIVIRTGQNELKISEFNQWGENLRENLSRVLIENLSFLLDSDRIYLMPGLKRELPDYRILVRIIEFERGDDGKIRLAARWKLQNKSGKEILFRENLLLTGQKVKGGDYSAIAQAMSHLLGELSQRIAEVVQKPEAFL